MKFIPIHSWSGKEKISLYRSRRIWSRDVQSPSSASRFCAREDAPRDESNWWKWVNHCERYIRRCQSMTFRRWTNWFGGFCGLFFSFFIFHIHVINGTSLSNNSFLSTISSSSFYSSRWPTVVVCTSSWRGYATFKISHTSSCPKRAINKKSITIEKGRRKNKANDIDQSERSLYLLRNDEIRYNPSNLRQWHTHTRECTNLIHLGAARFLDWEIYSHLYAECTLL